MWSTFSVRTFLRPRRGLPSACMASHPLLYEPRIIDAIEAQVEGAVPALADAIRERLRRLKQLAANPAQHAFDVLMAARTSNDVWAARYGIQIVT